MALQLDLRHYETVVAIVELGTMTEAAKLLATSQSALSHRLAEAERRLGVQLFDRGPQRRLRPTRAGLVMHQTASRALADLERSETLLRAELDNVVATVRIAVGTYDCYHWYPGFLAAAREQHPEIDLELVVVGETPGTALAAGLVDLVLAMGEPQGLVSRHPLFDDDLVLVVAPDHVLASRSWIDAAQLEGETYLTYNPIPTPGFEYDRFIRPSETYPRIVTVVPQTSAIAELVAAGAGISILSRWALAPMIESGRITPVRCGREGLPLSWTGLTRADESPDSATSAVMSMLHAHLNASV